jgi:excisionase family DNA binding protein
MDRNFLSTKEVARILGVSYRTLQRIAYDGLIAYTQKNKGIRGSKMLFKVTDVEKYLESKRKPSVYELVDGIDKKLTTIESYCWGRKGNKG